jgi:aerobic-type carbon monoxide dehydrogenase small subunit (CoxS/CutS family)
VSGPTSYALTVNGRAVEVPADDETSLLHVLRQVLDLAGPRFGCGVGLCGACFVLLDGKATPACDTPMWAAAGKDVVTVEGLGDDDALHPVQQAFLEEGAFQCGYCTAGMIMGAVSLLERTKQPTEQQVAEWMNPHICRCCTYPKIRAAVMRAVGIGGKQP